MKYRIVIVFTPDLQASIQDGGEPFHTIDVDTEAGGYFLTDPTATFLEVCAKAGVVEVFPLRHIVQFVSEEIHE